MEFSPKENRPHHQRSVSVSIKEDYARKIKELSTFRETDELAPRIYQLVNEAAERRQAVKGPHLKFRGAEGNSVLIEDLDDHRIHVLMVQEGDLFCEIDQRKDCKHIGFAWANPEVSATMRMHGSKKPETVGGP